MSFIQNEFKSALEHQDTFKIIKMLVQHPDQNLDNMDIYHFYEGYFSTHYPTKPLEIAVRLQLIDVAKALIEKGNANVNWCDYLGKTCLHQSFYVLRENDDFDFNTHVEIITYIIQATNFNIFAKDKFKATILDLFFEALLYFEYNRNLPANTKQLIKYLSEKYFEHNFFTSNLIFQLFMISMLYDLDDLIKDIFYFCFYWKKETPGHQMIKKFIEIFDVEANPQYYAFCVVMLTEIDEETKVKPQLFKWKKEICWNHEWNYEKFEERNNQMIINLLKCSFDNVEKLNFLLDCLKCCKTFVNNWIFYHSGIKDIDINPMTKNEICGLFKFFHTLYELNAGCIESTSSLEFYDVQFNIKVKLLWPFLDEKLVQPPEYYLFIKNDIPSLKELSRRFILTKMHGGWISCKQYKKNIESLKLPKILIRYLRFMDELPEIN